MPIRPLSKELQEVAIKELNEVPSRVQADLNHIREWISQQPHLKARTDDQWLLAFLRGTKFSLQRTKEKLDACYTIRNLVPELYENRDPLSPEIQEMLNSGLILVLPKTAHAAAPRIAFNRASKMDIKKMSLMGHFKLTVMMGEILMLEDDNFVVSGVSYMWDLKNVSASFAPQATVDYIKNIFRHIQDVYPVRLKDVNFFNTPGFFVAVYNAIKFLCPEKIRNRIHLHSEDHLKTLFESEYVSTEIFPQDEASWNDLAVYWKAKVESYRDWFLEDAQYGTDETKRVGKPKINNDMFGVEGSFIKLEID